MDKIYKNQQTDNETNHSLEKRNPLYNLVLTKKQFLINKRFQFQFMLSVLLICICSMTIIYLANYYFFQSYIHKGIALNLSPDHPYFLMIYEQKNFMTKVYVIVASCLSTISLIWGLFYSHKIAGPLFRLQRYFTHAAVQSEPLSSKIYFREDDYFQEVPESINKYIDSVNCPQGAIKEVEYQKKCS